MKVDKKNIYFLVLGIGTGMLLTSVLNIINPRIEYEQYTDEQIKQRASELGMVSIKGVINENKNKEDVEAEVEVRQVEEPADINASTNNVTETDEEAQLQEPEVASVIISKGDTSEEIVEKLYNKGIIDNKETFFDFILEKNVQRKFNYGKFEIVKGIDYESLIGMLTNN